jgi:hypothetical protein
MILMQNPLSWALFVVTAAVDHLQPSVICRRAGGLVLKVPVFSSTLCQIQHLTDYTS